MMKPGESEPAMLKPIVHDVTVRVCQGCIDLEGEMCSTPECVFCFRGTDEAKWLLDKMLICPIIDGERYVLAGNAVEDEQRPSLPTSAARAAADVVKEIAEITDSCECSRLCDLCKDKIAAIILTHCAGLDAGEAMRQRLIEKVKEIRDGFGVRHDVSASYYLVAAEAIITALEAVGKESDGDV